MSNKTFKTVTFGGFDKNAVQTYISEQMTSFQKQVKEKEDVITDCTHEIERMNKVIKELELQLKQKDVQLEEALKTNHELKNTVMLREDKIETLEQQMKQLENHIKNMQSQTRHLIEETNQKYALKIQELENEADQRVEAARLNAIELFDKINHDYQQKRKNYAEMVKAINELSIMIQKADQSASRQLSSLPESLLNKK